MHSAVCRRVRCGPSCSSPTDGGVHRPVQASGRVSGRPGHPRHRPRPSGHGGSIRTRADYGYFAQPDGNRAVLDDLHAVTALTKQLYPGVPYFLLGHSMARSTPGSTFASGAMSLTEPSSWVPASSPKRCRHSPDALPGAGRLFRLGAPQQAGGEPLLPRLQQGARGPHASGLAQP